MKGRPLRLGVFVTHPIQYQVPWFQALAREPGVALTVHFCMLPNGRQQGVGFGEAFRWDIPLLEGYEYRVLRNRARRPSVSRFWGCHTPEIGALVARGALDALIIHGWHTRSCLQALAACKRAGVPCIVRGESNLIRKRTWVHRLVHRWLLRRYAAFLSVGRSNYAFYRANGVPEAIIFPGPYCVDNARFGDSAATARPRRRELRKRWGIEAKAFVFLFCGKLAPKKRPVDLIQALGRLGRADRLPTRQHLLVVGDGVLRARCEREAAELGLAASFAGFLNQSHLPEAYAVSDALVLPSDNGETWGLVVNEAMATGVAAIVSDQVGCQEDLVTPGVTGDVFACGDIDGLARLLERWLHDPSYVRGLASNARTRIKSYSVADLVEGTLRAASYVGRQRGAA